MRQTRFGLSDTPEHIEKLMVELLKKKTPEERLRMTLDRMEFLRELRKAAEKQQSNQTNQIHLKKHFRNS